MKTAIGYVRVSTESQLDGFGPEIQEEQILRLANAEGLTLVAMYRDEGISGAEDLSVRLGLADAIVALDEHPVLIVGRLDRIARDLMIQEKVLAECWATGAEVIPCSPSERVYCHPDDPEDPMRKLIRQFLGALAEYDRSNIKLRLTRGRRRKLATTGYAGGPVPYGWTDDAERQVLADVGIMRQRGSTWQEIADSLNAYRRFKRNGQAWTASEAHRAWSRHTTRNHPSNQDAML